MAKWAIQKIVFNDLDSTAEVIDECVYGETFRTKKEAEAYLADMYDSMGEGEEIVGCRDADWHNDDIQYEVGKLE